MARSEIGKFFQNGDESAAGLIAWWTGLQEDRAGRATLRRAASPADVVYCPAYHRLVGQNRESGFALGARHLESLACVAGLAAHVRNIDASRSIGAQMAAQRAPGSNSRLGGLRFRRLVACTTREELYPLLVRTIRLLDGTVNLVDLANGVFWWNERSRKAWAYDYYANAPTEA